jgi:ketosteroid isomerase-like protein
MRISTVFLFVLASCTSNQRNQPLTDRQAEEAAIKVVLDNQIAAWNEANIDEFMRGYYKSDSILFVGSKITSGWDSTLVRYKRSYPDKAAMGKLKFEILRTDYISFDCYLVTGKYFLTREKDNPSGIFTLLFRKKNGNWVIVYDHTS